MMRARLSRGAIIRVLAGKERREILDRYQRAGATPPFFTAPGSVVWLSGAIVALHVLRLLLPGRMEDLAFYHFALIPERLSLALSGSGNEAGYSIPELLVAALGHATLHLDWMHVIVNTAMLLALGAPVARRLGARRFLVLFAVSVVAGGALFLALRLPDGAPAVGASGGVSGVIAAALLQMADPRATWPALVSPHFLKTSLAFLIANMALAVFGPALFGAGIAWDAHIGGYIAGALVMAAMAGR